LTTRPTTCATRKITPLTSSLIGAGNIRVVLLVEDSRPRRICDD
jgi:hypothetical protein